MTDDSNPPENEDRLPADVLAQLRAPVSVDGDARERHIAVALDHFRAGAADGPPATVVPLAARRRTMRIVAAAAAVLVVVGGVWLTAGRSSTPRQTADVAPSTRPSFAPPTPAKAGGAAAPASSLAPSPALAAPNVQQSEGYDRAADSTALSTVPAPTGPVTTCHAPRLRASLVSVGTVTVGGTVRLVYTYAWGPDGRMTTTVDVNPQTCTRF